MSTAASTITIPTEPPRALLISMAMRLHHDWGMDAWVQAGTGQRHPLCGGFTDAEREVVLVEMAQLYEEVVGRGFYRWEAAADPELARYPFNPPADPLT